MDIGTVKVKIVILGYDLNTLIGKIEDLVDKITDRKKKVKVIVAGHAHVKKD